MRNLILYFVLSAVVCNAQLSVDSVHQLLQKYQVGYSSYFEPFVGKPGYGAAWIMTADGGAAAMGTNVIYKFNKAGKEEWKREIKTQYDEMEPQGVVQDSKGNIYVFLLSYDHKRYRGGSERVLCYDKKGKLLWDKTLGAYTMINNPTVSYIRSLNDGRIYLRGHITKETPAEGKDPVYRYWEGWLDSTGKFTQKASEVLDWSNKEQQKKFQPE